MVVVGTLFEEVVGNNMRRIRRIDEEEGIGAATWKKRRRNWCRDMEEEKKK